MFEHADWRSGFHPDWNTYIYNYGRNEVRSFLMSSAMFWLDKYHVDGLRVDAVASMLYLDYSRREGEWIPNKFGGRENLDAIEFLRQMNLEAYKEYPGIQTYAEESTAWPMVSKPVYLGGLGFGMKWDMGWMHDTLKYFELTTPFIADFIMGMLTFRMIYGFSENFVLPLSHDEVVHGKGSIVGKMPGDEWQRFANLRLLYGYMFAQPGKKLLFMGDEFGQVREWGHDMSLEWHVLQFPVHSGVQKWVEQLNRAFRNEPALHELDSDPAGFEWVDCNDTKASVISMLRKGKKPEDTILDRCAISPRFRAKTIASAFRTVDSGKSCSIVTRRNTRAAELAISAASRQMKSRRHGRPYSLAVTLPPLGAVFFKWDSKK